MAMTFEYCIAKKDTTRYRKSLKYYETWLKLKTLKIKAIVWAEHHQSPQ